MVPSGEFRQKAQEIPKENSVDAPWTVKEIVKAPNAYTNSVADCTAGGITDGKDVVMFHINPADERNLGFSKLKSEIMKFVDTKSENLRGFLLGGSFYTIFESFELFDELKKMMNENNIPCTIIKGQGENQYSSILYNSKQDEWLICNNTFEDKMREFPQMSKQEHFRSSYEDIKLAADDEFIWGE